jgi:hypothetical protein
VENRIYDISAMNLSHNVKGFLKKDGSRRERNLPYVGPRLVHNLLQVYSLTNSDYKNAP